MSNVFKKLKSVMNGKMVVALSPKKEKMKKIVKYSFCFGLPLLGAILGSTLGIMEYNKKLNPQNEIIVEVTKDEINRRVYLISNDNLTIPLSVSLEKKSTIHEQIMDVYNLLKTDSKLQNNYLKGFINKDIKMNKIEVKDNILSLDFSENIFDNEFNNTKVLEALTMSFLSFDEIDGLEVYINGTKLNDMVSIYIPEVLDENYGINQDFYYTSSLIGKEKQVVFYERKYSNEHSYLVPVTVYCDKEQSINQTFVNATKVSQPVSSLLKKISLYNVLENNQDSEEHQYEISKEGLVDEECVNKELFDLLTLSYDLMGYDSKVSFVVEGEVVAVDGIYQEEDTKVNNIIFNEVKI